MSGMEDEFSDALETLLRASRRLGPDGCRDLIAAHCDEMRQEGEDVDTDGILLLTQVRDAFEALEGWQDGCDRVITLADLTVYWTARLQWDSTAPGVSAAYDEAIREGVARMLTPAAEPGP